MIEPTKNPKQLLEKKIGGPSHYKHPCQGTVWANSTSPGDVFLPEV